MELGDILHDGHMEFGCLLGRMTCFGGALGILENDIEPRWHGYIWLLAWRFVLDLRMLGLRSDHVGGVDLEEHMT